MDLIGQRFGKLLVVSLYRRNHCGCAWKCLCDCGNEKILSTSRLQCGKHYCTRSCGCGFGMRGKRNPKWRGCEEMNGRYMKDLKRRAKKRNLEFSISSEFMWNLFIKQNRKCALSGLGLSFNTGSNKRDGNASLDRKDSTKGYTEDNVQWVHKDINWMKQDFSDEHFQLFCLNVYKNTQKNIVHPCG